MVTLTNCKLNTLATLLIDDSSVTVTAGDVSIYLGGTVAALAVSISKVGGSLTKIQFTPTSSGTYFVTYKGSVVATLEVFPEKLQEYLSALKAEAFGSWTWNKETGDLTLLNESGVTVGMYKVVDTPLLSSREKVG